MKKYATVIIWDYETGDECDVFYAGDFEREHDGDNYSGSRDSLEMFCSDTLEEAITNAQYWPPEMKFSSEFSDAERNEIVGVINKLMARKDFVQKFDPSVEVTRDITVADLKIVDFNNPEAETDIPEPVEEVPMDGEDNDREYGEE